MTNMLFYNDINFDTFRVERSNCEAVWAAKEFAENPYGYGTLYIYGPTGTGRTHLTTSVEKVWEEQGLEFRELMGDILLFELQLDDVYKQDFTKDAFCAAYEDAKALLIEDLEIFAGKEEQEYLGALLESFLKNEKPVFITGTKKPETFQGWNEWIVKCINGPSVEIKQAELELRMRVLQEYVERWNYDFSADVLRTVAKKADTVGKVLDIWRDALIYTAYGKESLTEDILLHAPYTRPLSEEEIMEAKKGLLDLMNSWTEK